VCGSGSPLSASSSSPTWNTPAGLAADSGTGRGTLPPAGSAAATSGPGRKTGISRSAAAAASLPTLPSSTKPPWDNSDPSLIHGPLNQPCSGAGRPASRGMRSGRATLAQVADVSLSQGLGSRGTPDEAILLTSEPL